MRFHTELKDLRRKLDCKWHDKLNLLEQIASDPGRYIDNFADTPAVLSESVKNNIQSCHHQQCSESSSDIHSFGSPLDGSVPFELTINEKDNAVIPRRSESSVKWLVMPWQVLVTTDKGVLSSVEETLSRSEDNATKIQTCQFITNIMVQDFPAEVFLQRPTTINMLLALLQSSKNENDLEPQTLIITILKTLYKLARSLRFRIYYYCDPSIAHKAQKILARNIQILNSEILHQRDSPEGEQPEEVYQKHQPRRQRNRNSSLVDNVDDSVLQLQQLFIPNFCTEALVTVLKLISISNDSIRPLKIVRYIADLVYELVQLLITSVMPTVWFCNDNVALKIHENVKVLLEILSEILDYFGQFNNVDYYRATYLYFLWITVKMLSNIIPLELADQVIPKRMKVSLCAAIMDAPVYLMYQPLHATLQEYARRFRGPQECDVVKLLDETRLITKSMKAAISLMKSVNEKSYSEELKAIHASKLSLIYHKNFKLIKKFIALAQNRPGYSLSEEDVETTLKITLSLLAHSDDDIQEAIYTECHALVKAILGNNYGSRYTWKNILFLIETSILTEIICHGMTHENEKISNMSQDILFFLLNGKAQMTDSGWMKFLETLIPVLPLLQCLAHPISSLGKSITKMLNPDYSSSFKLPYIEVLKGNTRLLFSPHVEVRDEALYRILWLLAQEKNSSQKLPRLSSLHGLPLNSLCVFEKQTSARRPEGNYQRSALISVLEMLESSNIEPKIRKSALVQLSVMLTDISLHKVFISQNGLPLILDIFSKALLEKDFINYPDSVISVVTILKLLVSNETSVRIELSNRIDVYFNILRSLFLYPNNESVKTDAAQLLSLLLYNSYIMKLTEKSLNNPYNISLPYIITVNMKLPFTCKVHWKTSVHKRSDVSVLHRNNPVASTFVRQFWAWEWNEGKKILWKKWQEINDPMISVTLIIKESELACIVNTSLHYCMQQQLYNIQNSITHNGVSCAIDYLTIYMKLCHLINDENLENIIQLSWSDTFERFLHSYPTCKEDYELFVNVLNFLHLYVKVTHGEESKWLCKAVKNMMKSLTEWIRNTESGSEDIYQSMLRLTRACSMIDDEDNDDSRSSWISFIEFTVSNLFFGDYYNLAFLAWVLSTLTYVISKCQWKGNEETLLSTGNALIELIFSFSQEGSASFMGLTITRDCIICLNHVLHQMQIHLHKNVWTKFWYDKEQSLSFVPVLWRSRDPLVRASSLQLLASLINGPHTALQLLTAIDLSPVELCHSLLYFITAQEESCIVKEEACLAMSNLIKNSNAIVFQYVDEFKPSVMLSYVTDNNVYHEIAVMFSNLYMSSTLDPDVSDMTESDEDIQTQSLTSSRTSTTVSMVPKIVYYLYDCGDNFQGYSAGNSDMTDDQLEFITTPTLITALCMLLNNLIGIGEHEVIHEIFEHSLYKHIVGCFGEIPKNINGERKVEHYGNVLEMYTSLCAVLTNCVINSPDFASIVTFSPEFLRHLLNMLNKDLYFAINNRLVYLRNRLSAEILKFLTSLSLTENQHFDSFQVALTSCNTQALVKTICEMVKTSKTDLGMSAASFFAFLLSQEIQNDCEETKISPLKEVLDSRIDTESNGNWGVKKLSAENLIDQNVNSTTMDESCLGAEICKALVNLFIAHNYVKLVKKTKYSSDKDVITVALTNLLCVSVEAKKFAIGENFPTTCMMVLKELYIRLNAIPIHKYKSQADRTHKLHPLLHEIDLIYILLMNFMYDSVEAKNIFAAIELADIIHKLWAHTSVNKKTLITNLKLLSTFTTNCVEASHSLCLTTVTPGVGLRKTPNSLSLIHVIMQMVAKELDVINRNSDCQKLNFAFQILRNAIHSHECRVVISKSNLLQFFTKIHPSTTKRTKLWQIVEINCLEFLIDFTFYDEGQLAVSKAVDSLEVLINLARLSTGSPRLLAISILRNLAFNSTNRPRLLGSSEFLELLLSSLKEGTVTEIEVAGSTLWSLISNNQKGKLIARNAGFPHAIQTVLSRLSIQQDNAAEEQELVAMLEYVHEIMSH
ncbi:rotatin isoform X2 [Phymastichus coffea]|nr:rotatin isoform X2 [Phymastichus coffea]